MAFYESKIKISKVKEILKIDIRAYQAKVTDLIPVIAGAPGIGKSSLFKELSQELNLALDIFSIGASPYEYFSGIPEFEDVNYQGEMVKAANWSLPDVISHINKLTEKALEEGKDGLLVVLDDMHLMDNPTQKFMYEFFQNKTLQKYKLNKKAILVGAMNDSVSNGLEDIMQAVLDRISLYMVEFDFDYWYRKFGLELYPAISAYLFHSPNAMLGLDKVNTISASPRSWTELSNVLNFLKSELNPDEEKTPSFMETAKMLAYGKVGEKEAIDFYSFMILFNQFDYEAIFEKNDPDHEIRDDILDQVFNAFMVRYITTREQADLFLEILFANKDLGVFFSTAINEIILLLTATESNSDISDQKIELIKYIQSEILKKNDPEVYNSLKDFLI